MLRYLPFLLILAVWIYAFIDCLNTPEQEVRKLPKVVWVIIILLFGQVLLGPVAWFAVGRPRRNAPYGATRPQERQWVAPDDNPDFLKSLGKEQQQPGRGGPEEDGSAEPGTSRADAGADLDADADTAERSGDRPAGQSPRTPEEQPEQPQQAEKADRADSNEAQLRRWEDDLRRREEDLRRRERGGPEDTAPPA